MSTYDEALTPHRVAADRFRMTSDPGYHLWRDTFVHGGYLLAVATRTLAAATGHPSPSTLTAHFLDRVVPGEFDLVVDVLREGRHSFATATVEQGGVPRTRFTAVFADQAAAEGVAHLEVTPPQTPPFEDGDLRRGVPASTYPHWDPSWRPSSAGFLDRAPSGATEVVSRWRRADGEPIDVAGLALLSDIMISPAMEANLMPFAWVPTLELTAHFHVPETLHREVIVRMQLPAVTRGYATEDVDIWSADGSQLLVTGRQLALVRA